VSAELELLDWKRRVFALYAALRSQPGGAGVAAFRAARDELFREHPQSPLPREQRAGYGGVPWFPYDPAARVTAAVAPAEPQRFELDASAGEPMAFVRFGAASFAFDGQELRLDLYWLDAYGGGLFVPFGDATSGSETYGGGRYLLDTVKGADLGITPKSLTLDFNFSYHPSCSYQPAWVCPLPPPANTLPVPVFAGERTRS